MQYTRFYQRSEPIFLNICVSKIHIVLLTILLILCGDNELIPGPVNESFLSGFGSKRELKITHLKFSEIFNLLEALVNNYNFKIDIISLCEVHIVEDYNEGIYESLD